MLFIINTYVITNVFEGWIHPPNGIVREYKLEKFECGLIINLILRASFTTADIAVDKAAGRWVDLIGQWPN